MQVLAFAVVATLLALLCVIALLAFEMWSFQTSAVCLSDHSWVDNSKSVSPCYLAAVLCAGHSKAGPTSASQDSPSGILDWLVPRIGANDHSATATGIPYGEQLKLPECRHCDLG